MLYSNSIKIKMQKEMMWDPADCCQEKGQVRENIFLGNVLLNKVCAFDPQ